MNRRSLGFRSLAWSKAVCRGKWMPAASVCSVEGGQVSVSQSLILSASMTDLARLALALTP